MFPRERTSQGIKFSLKKWVIQYTKMLLALWATTFSLGVGVRKTILCDEKIDLSILLHKNFGVDVRERCF